MIMENLISNNLFKKAVEFNPTGTLIFNSENKIQFANKIAIRLFGFSEDDFYNLELPSLLSRSNSDDELPCFSPADNEWRDIELEEYDLLGTHKDGKEIPMKVSVGYTRIGSDIYGMAYLTETPTKSPDQETNILLSKIFHESLHDIYIISAENLQFLNANTGALKKIGYTLEEIQQLSPWDLKSDHDDFKFSQRIDLLLTGKAKKVIFESEFKCKDSSTYPVEIHMKLFEDGDRKVFIETVIDLSEKKRMEREHMNTLIQAQESEKERIAKELHDDLGQSLTALQLNIHTLEQCYDKPSTVNAKEIFDRLNYIIQNTIVDLKTISRDLMPSVLMDFGLVKALQYLCESFNSPRLQVNLQVYNMDQVLVTTQRVALYRIAQELIHNSIKHGKAKEVNVQVIKNDKNVLLTVEDDGIGFDINNSIYNEGLGIKSIQSRVIALEGNFSFDSRLEYGTSALVEIPLNYSL